MAIDPDDSEYGGQTITGAGWVHVNEDALASAAASFEELESHLRYRVVTAAGKQRTKLADSWEGAGSEAALEEASAIINKHEANADAAKDAASRLRNMEASVVKTKIAVNKNADEVQRDCDKLNNTNLRGEVRAQRIADRIAAGVAENIGVVSANTVELSGNLNVPLNTPGADGKMPEAPPPQAPPPNHGQLGKPTQDAATPRPPEAPPAVVPASNGQAGTGIQTAVHAQPPAPPVGAPPSGDGQLTSATQNSVTPQPLPPPPPPPNQPARASSGGSTGPAPPAPSVGGGPSGSPGISSGPSGSPGASSPSSPLSSSSSGGTSSSGSPSEGPASAGEGAPATDAAKAAAGGQPTGTPPQTAPLTNQLANTPLAAQPSVPTPPPAPAPIPDAPPPTQPPGAPAPTGAPAGHAAPPPPPVGAAPGAGAPPGTSMPLGPPATPPPAAPLAPPGTGAPAPTPMGPGVGAASAAGATSAVGAPAPVPVSAARAERDAIAAAATAGALRRQSSGGSDPLQLARRIGAALNAEPNIDFGFFWVTALTQEGQILVANSYGLAYIPEGVNLPEQVRMASADESVPVGERAKWATYPILAVQGWAQHHNVRLRAVVATEDQFKNFDPGTARVTLRTDDIPDSGKMQGRNRLAVIAPAAAAQLAGVSPSGLSELLPPPPSDINPPPDETSKLWFEVMKPMMSTNPDRGVAHLEAFVKYADHAQEQALYRAHTGTEAVAQRAAIADWVYWQHLSVLISDALAGSAAK